jgi:ribosomal protein L10
VSKVIKKMEMDDLRGTFKDVRDLVLLTFDKLDSQGEYGLRKALREKKIRLKQVKNSLTRKVFKELNFSVPDESDYWQKPTVLAFGPAGVATISKAVEAELKDPKKAAKYRETVKVKGAIADGQPVAFDLAKTMPTREELVGQIVGMILGPAQSIAACLTGPAGEVASQIQTIADKKEDGAPAA